MTVDSSSLLTISIGTILALIAVAIGATATWTRVTVKLDAIAASLKELRSWHLKATESAGAELDDAVEAMRTRHHQTATRLQHVELRLHRLEDRSGIPTQIVHDLTPTPVDVPTGKHRRVPKSEESST